MVRHLRRAGRARLQRQADVYELPWVPRKGPRRKDSMALQVEDCSRQEHGEKYLGRDTQTAWQVQKYTCESSYEQKITTQNAGQRNSEAVHWIKS